jgi:GntR family transcriptional regulator, histidine utilization repressor
MGKSSQISSASSLHVVRGGHARKTDSEPSMHARILSHVRARILSGEWPPGHRIPFEHEFVESYGCSRMTVNKALSRLAEAGLIERRRKSGSVVAWPRSVSAVLEITEVPAEVAALGLEHGFAILSRSIRRATEADRERSGGQVRAKVLDITCRHDAGGTPFCLETRLVNLASVPEAESQAFDERPPGSWLLARVPWTRAENRISAAPMSRDTAQALGLAGGTACLEIVRRTWRDDVQVTWVKFIYSRQHELVARFYPAGQA